MSDVFCYTPRRGFRNSAGAGESGAHEDGSDGTYGEPQPAAWEPERWQLGLDA